MYARGVVIAKCTGLHSAQPETPSHLPAGTHEKYIRLKKLHQLEDADVEVSEERQLIYAAALDKCAKIVEPDYHLSRVQKGDAERLFRLLVPQPLYCKSRELSRSLRG